MGRKRIKKGMSFFICFYLWFSLTPLACFDRLSTPPLPKWARGEFRSPLSFLREGVGGEF
jgi:hypothetical protein